MIQEGRAGILGSSCSEGFGKKKIKIGFWKDFRALWDARSTFHNIGRDNINIIKYY